MTAHGLLAEAKKLGVKLVQFADNISLTSLPATELGVFESACRASETAVEVGTRGLEIRDLHHHLALARRFKSPFVRVVTDLGADQPSPLDVVDRLRVVRDEYRAAGVRIALENHDRFSARTLLRIIETLGTDFAGICLDTVNSFGALEGPEQVVEVLGPHALCVHVKDFTVQRPPHQMGFTIEGCPAGKGRLNVPWLIDTLASTARQPFSAVLETWVTPGPDLAETLARERAWTEQGVEYLRTLIPD